jgi:hypothetical protein
MNEERMNFQSEFGQNRYVMDGKYVGDAVLLEE